MTCFIFKNGCRMWNSEIYAFHRDSGPALISPYQSEWYSCGVKYKAKTTSGVVYYFGATGNLHRMNGPAVEYEDGYKEWWKNGQLHRLDGPAIEDVSGHKEWWINGTQYTKETWEKYNGL